MISSTAISTAFWAPSPYTAEPPVMEQMTPTRITLSSSPDAVSAASSEVLSDGAASSLSAASAWLLSSADVPPAAASWAEELQPERAAAVMAAVNRIDKPLFLINPSSFFGLQRF